MPTENMDWELYLDSDGDVDLLFDSESDLGLEMDRPIIHGTDDYNELRHKPTINEVEIVGDKTIPEILNGHWLLLNGMTSEERMGAT